MSKVSVIIPVYNTEKYLKKCLDSVCNQTLSDIEIICIDDCSTDNSLSILKEYALSDKRIKIIELKKNSGPSKARNLGILNAKGEYLGFVDSDDYIDLNFYKKLYDKAVETGADIVKGSDMVLIHEDGISEIDKQNDKIKKNKINFWSQYTTAIFNREFILKNKICFPEDLIVGEDPVFAIRAAILSDKIEIINNAQYYYVRHEGSLNSDYWNSEKIASYIKYINLFIDFSKQYEFSEEMYKMYYTRLLEDIYWTRFNKTTIYGKNYRLLTALMKKVRKNSVKGLINVLFDATVLQEGCVDNNAKRGIYWVTYNLAKKFIEDKRFDVTFLLETSIGNRIHEELPIFKDVKIISQNFYLGAGANFKVIENKNFKPKNYDVYFNTGHSRNLYADFKPLRCYYLHDVMPMLKYDWFEQKWKDYFESFHKDLTSDDYAFCVSNDCKSGFLRFFDKLDEDNIFVPYNSTAQNFKVLKEQSELKNILAKYNVQYLPSDKYIFYMGAVDDTRI
jgi:glycosyltransferase involved in cell wall biosynthesis